MCEAIEGIRADAREEGVLKTLIELVKKGLPTITQAAEEANMVVHEFEGKTSYRS